MLIAATTAATTLTAANGSYDGNLDVAAATVAGTLMVANSIVLSFWKDMYRPLAPSTGDRTARRVVLEVVLKLVAVYTAIRVLAFAVLGPLIIVGAVSDLYSRSSHYEASIEAGVSIYVATFGLSTLFSSAKIVLRSSPVFTSIAARLGVKSATPDPPPTTPVGGRARP